MDNTLVSHKAQSAPHQLASIHHYRHVLKENNQPEIVAMVQLLDIVLILLQVMQQIILVHTDQTQHLDNTSTLLQIIH